MYFVIDSSEKIVKTFDYENSAMAFIVKANRNEAQSYNICLRNYRKPFRLICA